jgi:hypothetical protein
MIREMEDKSLESHLAAFLDRAAIVFSGAEPPAVRPGHGLAVTLPIFFSPIGIVVVIAGRKHQRR